MTIKMEEKAMIISIICMIIGALIAITGIYYLVKEKQDKESVKTYGIISVIGCVVFIVSLIILLTKTI